MPTIATLVVVQTVITRYALSIIVALGNLGNLLTIGIYLQKKHRTNSCAIYLLASSCFCLTAANWAIIPVLYALDHFDMVNNSLVLCRIRGYVIHTCSMCFRYTLVLVCVDRYALCNMRVFIRALSRPQIAYRSIAIITIFWSVVSVHLLIWESIEDGRCGVYGIYGQIFSYYITIFTGLIPIFLMIFFAILLVKRIRRSLSQVQPLNTNNRLHRREVFLIKVVLVEIVVYIVCTFMYPPVTVYLQVTSSITPSKTAERQQIESFVNFIFMSLLLYLNYNTAFYIHISTSKIFRNEVKQFVLKCIRNSRQHAQNRADRWIAMCRTLRRQQLQRTTIV